MTEPDPAPRPLPTANVLRVRTGSNRRQASIAARLHHSSPRRPASPAAPLSPNLRRADSSRGSLATYLRSTACGPGNPPTRRSPCLSTARHDEVRAGHPAKRHRHLAEPKRLLSARHEAAELSIFTRRSARSIRRSSGLRQISCAPEPSRSARTVTHCLVSQSRLAPAASWSSAARNPPIHR